MYFMSSMDTARGMYLINLFFPYRTHIHVIASWHRPMSDGTPPALEYTKAVESLLPDALTSLLREGEPEGKDAVVSNLRGPNRRIDERAAATYPLLCERNSVCAIVA